MFKLTGDYKMNRIRKKELTAKEKRRIKKKKEIKDYWKNLKLKKKSNSLTEEFINSLFEY